MTNTPDLTEIDAGDIVTVAIYVYYVPDIVPENAFTLHFFDIQISEFAILTDSLKLNYPTQLDFSLVVSPGILVLDAHELHASETLNFTYQIEGSLQLIPNTTYTFATNISYYSCDIATGYTGRYRSSIASYSLHTISPTFITNFATSLPESDETATTLDASIGEYITVITAVQLIIGTNPMRVTLSSNLTSVSALNGLVESISEFVNGSLLAVGDAATLDIPANSLVYDFGTLVNSVSDLNETEQSLILISTFLVTNGTQSVRGARFDITTRIEYSTGFATSALVGTVVIPSLFVTVVTNISSYPLNRLEAGDRVSVYATLQHGASSNAAAYQIQFFDEDLIDPVLLILPASFNFSSNATREFTAQINQAVLPLGGVIWMSYVLEVQPSIVGIAPVNLSEFVEAKFATADVDSESYIWANADAQFTLSPRVPSAVCSIIWTSLPATPQSSATNLSMAVGETALLYLNISLMRGTNIMESLVQSVLGNPAFGAQIEITSSSIVALSLPPSNSNVSLNQSFVSLSQSGFRYASDISYTVLNDDYLRTGNWAFGGARSLAEFLVLSLTLTVTDLPNNIDGNTAAIQYDLLTPSSTSSGAITVNIVEPKLQWTKTVTGYAALTSGGLPLVDAATVLTWTITVTHVPGVSSAHAYQALLAENATTDMVFVPDGFAVLQAPPGQVYTLITGNGTGTQANVKLLLDELPLGATFQFSYQTKMTYAIRSNRTSSTTTLMTYDSCDDATGSTGRRRNLSIVSSVVSGVPTMATAFTQSNQYGPLPLGSTAILVEIGEPMTFETRVSLRPGLTPFALTMHASNIASIQFGNSTSSGAFVAAVNSSSKINATVGTVAVRVAGQNGVRLSLGNVLDGSDFFIDESITIRSHIRVLNVPTQNNGFITTIALTLDYGTGTVVNLLQVTLIEPELAFVHSYRIDPTWTIVGTTPYLQSRDVVTWDVAIYHTPRSNASAYFVAFSDERVLEMTFVPGSIVITDAAGGGGNLSIVSGNQTGDSELEVQLEYLPRGKYFNFSYQTIVTQDVLANKSFNTMQTLVQYLSNDYRLSTNNYVGRSYSIADVSDVFGVRWPTLVAYCAVSSDPNRM
jgi:hypothetical protein